MSGAYATASGGRRDRCITGEASLVRDLSASIVVIDIGSNDLFLPGVEPVSLARSINSLVHFVLRTGLGL